jgi:ribosomal protein S2
MVVAIPVPLNKLSKKSIALHIKQLAQLGNIEEYYEKAGTKVQKNESHLCGTQTIKCPEKKQRCGVYY